jgi:hypothetical protein
MFPAAIRMARDEGLRPQLEKRCAGSGCCSCSCKPLR